MKLQNCDKAQIFTLDKSPICTAQVVGDVKETALLRFHESCIDILRTEVIVTFFDSIQGLVSCSCQLSDYNEELDELNKGEIISTVQCTILAQQEVIQRRQDIKIPVSIKADANFLNSEDELETSEITILDLSAGGLFCITTQKWEQGQTFELQLFVSPLPILVEILRQQTPHSYSDRFKEDDERYGYGCRFVNLPNPAEAALRQFVFKEDLLRRKSIIGAD